jgi:hypothetical protein
MGLLHTSCCGVLAEYCYLLLYRTVGAGSTVQSYMHRYASAVLGLSLLQVLSVSAWLLMCGCRPFNLL